MEGPAIKNINIYIIQSFIFIRKDSEDNMISNFHLALNDFYAILLICQSNI